MIAVIGRSYLPIDVFKACVNNF